MCKIKLLGFLNLCKKFTKKTTHFLNHPAQISFFTHKTLDKKKSPFILAAIKYYCFI